jgi:hypothetical protein
MHTRDARRLARTETLAHFVRALQTREFAYDGTLFGKTIHRDRHGETR